MPIKRARRYAIALSALAIVFLTVVLPATANAATAPAINLGVTMTGAPSHLPTTGQLAVTISFTNKNPQYRVKLLALGFSIWNACTCQTDATHGTPVTYRDPGDGTWRSAPSQQGIYDLRLATPMQVNPGETISIPAKLKLTEFHSGTYKIDDSGGEIGDIFDIPANTPVDNYQLHWNIGPQRTITIGATAPQPTTRPITPAPHRTSHTTASPTTATTTTTTTAPATTLTPTPSSTAQVLDRPTTSPTTLVAHATTTTGSNLTPWVLLLTGLTIAAVGGLALRHRRRHTPTT